MSFLIVVIVALTWTFANSNNNSDNQSSVEVRKVLQGITEPFDVNESDNFPTWKVLKISADSKASGEHLQQALKEYGYILRHSEVFNEMPPLERYDIFLSMAKLLKIMGFHQRAETLLYESMSYSQTPFESHFQLSLLALEKEDLITAKMHLKNCLFLRESDTLVLIHFAVILMAEGKTHEAKFYISRILSALEGKVQKLIDVVKGSDSTSMFGNKLVSDPGPTQRVTHKWNRRRSFLQPTDKAAMGHEASGDMIFAPFSRRVEHSELQHWLEELMIRVFHGDYLTTLHEKDYNRNTGGNYYLPTKTSNLLETFQMFSNLYDWLADGELTGRFVFDIGQSLYESGKCDIGHAMMTRGHFSSNPMLEGVVSVEVVKIRLALDYPIVPSGVLHIIEAYLNMTQYLSISSSSYDPIDIENIMDVYWPVPLFPFSGLFTGPILTELLYRFNGGPMRRDSLSLLWLSDSQCLDHAVDSLAGTGLPAVDVRQRRTRIEIGIFGGHFNNHPVGLMVLHRLLSLNKLQFRITLVATPLHADLITRDIASNVDEIVNIPMATDKAWQIIEQKLRLDILLFPDWQPFPDQLNILFSSRRIAPVQICFYVRGSTCGAGQSVDYYLLPNDLYESYIQSTSVHYAVSMISKATPGNRNANLSVVIPPWLEAFHEQVVVVDWPVLTTHTINDIAKSVSALSNEHMYSSDDPTVTKGLTKAQRESPAHLVETEGQIFFDNQPVAILAVHPSYLHPLMDSLLVDILRVTAACQLQILLVLPEVHMSDAMMIPRYRISWARRLVRRLWLRAGTYSNRIRLLPSPVTDKRLLSLYRQADLVLDTFPFGSSLHSHALALSVGTPVVTLRSGTLLSTPHDELMEIKRQLVTSYSHKYSKNPVYQYILKNDIPWIPVSSPVGALYHRLSIVNATAHSKLHQYTIEDLLVAGSVKEYEQIVVHLATDKEAAYSIRVKLLDAVDKRVDHEQWQRKDSDDMEMNAKLEEFLFKVGNIHASLRSARVLKYSTGNVNQQYAPNIDQPTTRQQSRKQEPKTESHDKREGNGYFRSFLRAWIA